MNPSDRLPDALATRSQADALLAAVPLVFLVIPGIGRQFDSPVAGLGVAAAVGWLLIAYGLGFVWYHSRTDG
ncbi:MAG: hypothetical protein V5A46_10695 [Haloferacaceae archaeon]